MTGNTIGNGMSSEAAGTRESVFRRRGFCYNIIAKLVNMAIGNFESAAKR